MLIFNENTTAATGKTETVTLGQASVPSTLETMSEKLYASYCKAVGGVAFNGDPLPTWDEFANDPKKEKQVFGWRIAALEAIDFASSQPQL